MYKLATATLNPIVILTNHIYSWETLSELSADSSIPLVSLLILLPAKRVRQNVDQVFSLFHSLRLHALFSFQFYIKSGAAIRPRSAQDCFHRMRYCLRGPPRPCFASISPIISPFPFCYSLILEEIGTKRSGARTMLILLVVEILDCSRDPITALKHRCSSAF